MGEVCCNDRPRLDVCITCHKTGITAQEQGPVTASGAQLFEALNAANDGGVAVVAVKCLALCQQSCAMVISMQGKWGWLLGGLQQELAQDILQYAARYAQSKSGVVMPSKRPASLQNVMVGRFPALLKEV